MEKIAWLDHLYYDVGRQWTDFQLTGTRLVDGEQVFSKWLPYSYYAANPELLYRVNQRTQLLNEVSLDFDGSWDDYQWLIENIRKDGLCFYAYATRSRRAKCIHTYWGIEIAQLKPLLRAQFREKLIAHYGCDCQLKIDNHMIPIEHSPHWKSGEVVELIAYG